MTEDQTDAELLRRLDRALARLSPKRRNIFLLSRVEQKSFAEIAEAYGISEEQVLRHVAKAMWFLRRRANPEEFSFWQRWWPF